MDKPLADAIRKVAADHGLEPAALAAVAQVETGLRAFATVRGRAEPLIRFEGHYFDRRLSGRALEIARREGLASATAGAVANPAQQAARWAMLARAARIDRTAAYESTSWGLGQVMGAHWAWLGYRDVDALVAQAREGTEGQLRLMARYIERAGLAPALRGRDWHTFARGYNGPGYRANGYDTRLERAHRRMERLLHDEGSDAAAPVDLRRGSSGEAVARIQRLLNAGGARLAVDGRFGAMTEHAVRDHQQREGLAVDGIVGPATRASLEGPEPGPFAAWFRAVLARLSRGGRIGRG